MPKEQEMLVLEDDVFALTSKGRKELDAAGTTLSPSELKVLVLINGKSTIGETAVHAAALALEDNVVLYILRRLAKDGFIELVQDAGGSLDFVDLFASKGPATPSAAAIAREKKASIASTLLLQQHGYFVRIVRRGTTSGKPKGAGQNSVLVIEDEPNTANLLNDILTIEGFTVRIAKNRDDIVTELRRPPRPDLVLLDVMLPDADGFEILLKMRQHPALRTVPVVMLTAKATREAVLQGLAGGADGYITKPFDIAVLIKGVNAVLGLSDDGSSDELN